MTITIFLVSGILKEYLQAAIKVFRDGKYRPPRCVSDVGGGHVVLLASIEAWPACGSQHAPTVTVWN